MFIEASDIEAADALADLWVRLADEQRQHGSQLRTEANRETIRESILRAIVTEGLFVARAEPDDGIDADAGTILGFVMFSTESKSFETTVSRGTIQNLYVRPEYRNRGIGSELLDTATAALEDRGIEVVKLDVMADNEAAARFYERHGFEPHRVQLAKRVESDNHSKDRG
ncbi:GNAT family N-acetyltransferase [Halorientalis brevis]|uniref:GNAT family N-acetyltransferase n=1 Tax=Halorientalis brevis TaxID=1126241 RepID=A0ABD6CC32_9EURY